MRFRGELNLRPDHFVLEFLLELEICPIKKVVFESKWLVELLDFPNFLPQRLHFEKEFLQLKVINLIKLRDFQFDDLLSQRLIFQFKLPFAILLTLTSFRCLLVNEPFSLLSRFDYPCPFESKLGPRQSTRIGCLRGRWLLDFLGRAVKIVWNNRRAMLKGFAWG